MIKVVEQLNQGIAYLSAAAIMIAMFSITAGVFSLKIVDRSLPGVPELSELLLVVMIYLAVGYTQIKGRHVRVDILLERVSPRIRHRMEIVSQFLVLIILVFLVWQTGVKAIHAIEVGDYIQGDIKFPLTPSKISVFIGLLLLLAYIILDVIRRLRTPALEIGKPEASTKQEGEI